MTYNKALPTSLLGDTESLIDAIKVGPTLLCLTNERLFTYDDTTQVNRTLADVKNPTFSAAALPNGHFQFTVSGITSSSRSLIFGILTPKELKFSQVEGNIGTPVMLKPDIFGLGLSANCSLPHFDFRTTMEYTGSGVALKELKVEEIIPATGRPILHTGGIISYHTIRDLHIYNHNIQKLAIRASDADLKLDTSIAASLLRGHTLTAIPQGSDLHILDVQGNTITKNANTPSGVVLSNNTLLLCKGPGKLEIRNIDEIKPNKEQYTVKCLPF